jgi:hypothetical protein
MLSVGVVLSSGRGGGGVEEEEGSIDGTRERAREEALFLRLVIFGVVGRGADACSRCLDTRSGTVCCGWLYIRIIEGEEKGSESGNESFVRGRERERERERG